MKNMFRKKTYLIPVIAFLATALFAFRRPEHNIGHLQNLAGFRILNSNPHNLPDTGGRAVNIDSAQQCIARFAAVMKQHGFSDTAGQKVNIRIRRTSMITSGEVFDGKGLQDWLNNTAAQYQAAGKTLMISIQMGIYDSSYLNTYQSNPALRSKYLNRIAVFIIPYDGAATAPHQIHANIAPPPLPPGGGTGYDLGGIYP
mgnify:FL=1